MAFLWEELPSRVPAEFREFVAEEVATLVCRGYLVPLKEVRTIDGSVRPRITMPLSVEPLKPRPIYDARLLGARCLHVGLSLDLVGSVAVLGWEGCHQEFLDDMSGFHQVLLHPASWP